MKSLKGVFRMVQPNHNVPTKKSILLSTKYFSQLSLKILPGKIKNQLAESSLKTDLVGFPKKNGQVFSTNLI